MGREGRGERYLSERERESEIYRDIAREREGRGGEIERARWREIARESEN